MRILMAACLLGLPGCQSTSVSSDPRPPLVRQLADLGVSDANTRKIVIVDTEAGYGPDVAATITHDFLIQEIWDTIYQSRPYSRWAASGFRKLLFYKDAESQVPAAELLVNETDRCHFEGAFDDAYRCPGIFRILERELKAEHERRKSR